MTLISLRLPSCNICGRYVPPRDGPDNFYIENVEREKREREKKKNIYKKKKKLPDFWQVLEELPARNN